MDWKTEQLAIGQNEIKIEEYLYSFDNHLDLFGSELDDHEKGLLLLMSKAKLMEGNTTLMDYILAGDIVQSNLVGLHLRKEQLATVLKTAIENSRSKGKDRGGPKP